MTTRKQDRANVCASAACSAAGNSAAQAQQGGVGTWWGTDHSKMDHGKDGPFRHGHGGAVVPPYWWLQRRIRWAPKFWCSKSRRGEGGQAGRRRVMQGRSMRHVGGMSGMGQSGGMAA